MKIAVAGYGIEGESSLEYYRQLGHDVTVLDESNSLIHGVPSVTGPDAFRNLSGFDLVIRTAGLSPHKLDGATNVWSASNEFFDKCPAPIVGVTGTKGKGTTASLIASILRASGRTVHLVGNIGIPALSKLPEVEPDHVVVYELSSFQLWDLKFSPHIAVILPVEPDHLDVHENFDDYLQAKANIVNYQNTDDTVVYYGQNEWSLQLGSSSPALSKLNYEGKLADEFVEHLKLPGVHNQQNANAAVTAVRALYPDTPIPAIKQGLSSFDGLPHRLKFVAEKASVRYFDDSIATTPGSAMAAIRSFDESKVLILGGSDKGGDYSEIIDLCLSTDTGVVAIGETGPRIADLCLERGVKHVSAGDMRGAVEQAAIMSKRGGVVILSPASASFDMFSNYMERGSQFIHEVEMLVPIAEDLI